MAAPCVRPELNIYLLGMRHLLAITAQNTNHPGIDLKGGLKNYHNGQDLQPELPEEKENKNYAQLIEKAMMSQQRGKRSTAEGKSIDSKISDTDDVHEMETIDHDYCGRMSVPRDIQNIPIPQIRLMDLTINDLKEQYPRVYEFFLGQCEVHFNQYLQGEINAEGYTRHIIMSFFAAKRRIACAAETQGEHLNDFEKILISEWLAVEDDHDNNVIKKYIHSVVNPAIRITQEKYRDDLEKIGKIEELWGQIAEKFPVEDRWEYVQ